MNELEKSEIRKNHAIANLCEHITTIIKIYMITVTLILGGIFILVAALLLL